MKSNTIYPPMSEREISGAAISREAATQGMVLLKNINGVLPLKGRGKIALFGNGAARTIRGGTGSGDPFNGGLSGGGDQDVDQSLRYHINILNAMETEGFEIVNREQQMAWARCYDLAKREMKDQVMSVFAFPEEPLTTEKLEEYAKETETAICVISRNSGEGNDRFMKKEVEAGHQVYIICPMVEENEELELENVTDYTEKLKGILPEFQISCLHGKMKPKEKNEIMEAFADGQIQILVSTTVIEVGINVPNATVMMVENAERFGLAQLHQLRGRVGRGREQSYCIFMSGSKGKETKKRLEVLNQSNDGFFIASEDLKLRGPGDLFGIRQSGILEFKMGDVFQDAKVLEQASEAAGKILKEDPELERPEYERLKERLKGYMSRSAESISL